MEAFSTWSGLRFSERMVEMVTNREPRWVWVCGVPLDPGWKEEARPAAVILGGRFRRGPATYEDGATRSSGEIKVTYQRIHD